MALTQASASLFARSKGWGRRQQGSRTARTAVFGGLYLRLPSFSPPKTTDDILHLPPPPLLPPPLSREDCCGVLERSPNDFPEASRSPPHEISASRTRCLQRQRTVLMGYAEAFGSEGMSCAAAHYPYARLLCDAIDMRHCQSCGRVAYRIDWMLLARRGALESPSEPLYLKWYTLREISHPETGPYRAVRAARREMVTRGNGQ